MKHPDNSSEKISEVKRDLINHETTYVLWALKKIELVKQWGEHLEGLRKETNQPIDTIAAQILEEMQDLGAEKGAEKHVHEILKLAWKNKDYEQRAKHWLLNDSN